MNHEAQLLNTFNNNFGGNLCYQKVIVGILCLLWIQLSYISMIGSYVFMNPLFQCEGQETTETLACENIDSCKITNYFTATYTTGLYCEQEGQRITIQSAYLFGNIFGMLFVPMIGDSIGRRRTLIFAIICLIIGVLIISIGVFTKLFILMVLGQFANGIFCAGCAILTYVITAQACNGKFKQFSLLLYYGAWGISEASFILIYYFIPEWYNFLILCIFLPLVGISFMIYFFIKETPIFCLLNRKNIEDYEQAIRYIAIFNEPQPQQLNNSIETGRKILKQYIIETQQAQKKSVKSIIFELYKTKKYLKAIFLLTLIFTGISYPYYGASLSFERTGLNFGITMFLIGLSEFFTNVTCGHFMPRIPRKKGMLISLIFVSFMGILFIFPSIHYNQTLQTVIAPFYRMCSVAFFAFLIVAQVQSFDSTVKSTAFGILSCFTKVLSLAIPYLVSAMNDRGIHPLVACSILAVGIGLVPTLLLDETLKKQKCQDNEYFEQSLIVKEEQTMQ